MPYLDCVVKEVLRLYPPIPVNNRTATRTTTLPVGGGQDGRSPVLVRKGEAVNYCTYVMHRRKDIYGEDALAFRPERWEDNALNGVGYGYLPFNAGPRACLGRDFAFLEAKYAVVRIVQRFPFIAMPKGENTVETGKEKQMLTLALMCDEGCRVILRGTEIDSKK
jgi:cytochrome P450